MQNVTSSHFDQCLCRALNLLLYRVDTSVDTYIGGAHTAVFFTTDFGRLDSHA